MNRKSCFILLISVFTIAGCSAGTGGGENRITEGKGIVTDNGMVVTVHHESSRIGNEILMKGGNAVDAEAATEFALAVCYPEAGNIGGGGFMVIRMPDGRKDVIDYREKAPFLASRDMYLDGSGNVTEGVSTITHLASGVPGTVDGIIRHTQNMENSLSGILYNRLLTLRKRDFLCRQGRLGR